MKPADQSFAVHLDSLLGFAQELTTQVHGISKPSGELAGLLDAPVLLGAFNEADSLAATHAAAVAELHVLLADVQEALSFANDVTRTVADGYRRIDSDLGSYLGSDGVLSGDSGTNPASGAAGPSGATGPSGIAGVGSDIAGVAVSTAATTEAGLGPLPGV